MNYKIGFLGYGRMARAVSDGLNRNQSLPYSRQMISGRNQERLTETAAAKGLAVASDNLELVQKCSTIVLGVKPHQVIPVLEEIYRGLTDRLVISMAAGVSLEVLQKHLPQNTGLVRTMPNLGVLANKGVTLLCAPPDAPKNHLNQTREIFESVGLALDLQEDLFEAATALSGSGPAYIFSFLESLIRGAVRQGLPWETARILACQTTLGAAELALSQPQLALADLRDMTTSPGGVTAEALYVMEKAGMGGILQEAIEAATRKGRGLI